MDLAEIQSVLHNLKNASGTNTSPEGSSPSLRDFSAAMRETENSNLSLRDLPTALRETIGKHRIAKGYSIESIDENDVSYDTVDNVFFFNYIDAQTADC